MSDWAGITSAVATAMDDLSAEILAAYEKAPRLVEEHSNLERAAIEGGYGRRQLFELIQNGADEMLDEPGRVEVVLTAEALYCANQGRPLSEKGVGALLSSYRSPKRGVEIGRFGLGFKSVLGVTHQPQIFSRSGSIGFDPDEAAERIADRIGDVDRVPVLRVGRALDPKTARKSDRTLAELMSWATTVVRLRRDTDDDGWLVSGIKDFPAEFLLFAPHVQELVLRDVENDRSRTLSAKRDGEVIELVADDASTRWNVFSIEHHPTEVARADGGAMADRAVVPLVWAVPTRRRGIGQFWAFFPTLDGTTLSGVVNAPWKLNEDRTRLIDGPFNHELLTRLCALVLERGQELSDPQDPGVVLDLMPGRGREIRSYGDGVLTNTINELAQVAPSIPDQDGELELPSEIQIPPDVPRAVLDLWAVQPTRPKAWAHPSVDTTERRATALRYRREGGATSVRDWLEALVRGSDLVVASRSAVTVAAALLRVDPSMRDHISAAKIVLDAESELRAPADPTLFLPAELPVEVDTRFVHADLLVSAQDLAALETLGLHEVDAFRLLKARLDQADPRAWRSSDWELFWSLTRKSPRESVIGLLEAHDLDRTLIRVRTRAGAWLPIISVLLPGEIVGNDGRDDESTIDTGYHSQERAVLELLGAVRGPSEGGGSFEEPLVRDYRASIRQAYLKKLEGKSRPSSDLLDFRRRRFAGPLTPLRRLSPAARARYTAALLTVAGDLDKWSFGHTSQSKYPEAAVINPVAHAIRTEGVLPTSLGPRVAKQAVGPTFAEHRDVLPVASCGTAAARSLGLPLDASDLGDDQWGALLATLHEADSDAVIGAGYALAAANGVAPPYLIRCRVGHAHDRRGPEVVVVTADAEMARVLAETATPFVSVRSVSDAQALVDHWGLRADTDTVNTEVSWSHAGEPVPLGDRFPMLRLRLDALQRSLLLQPATELALDRFTETGRVSTPQTVVLHGDTLYHDADLTEEQLLGQVSSALALDLSSAEIDGIVRNLDAQRVRQLRTEIRRSSDDAARILAAINTDELRSHLPQTLIESVEYVDGELDERGVAELALVVHGARVLQEHKDELERRQLQPPTQWAGSRAAVAFVKDLGFGPEYAGFESRRLERVLEVEGPPKLGDLHEYQEIVVDEMRQLVRGEGGLRGLLSLPTGAGKTRVTIEALVQALRATELKTPILWVAQTVELCEQAVQSWSEVWRSRGPRERLTLSRLWSHFDADEVEHGHQVVVATIQKLSSGVYKNTGYDWLSRANCLVVDEAHQSVGPQYTALLEWQGMARNQQRIPVIGLTATPFRGVNVEETKRLVARYGRRRLDTAALGEEDAYARLQDLGVLAQVDEETLPGSEIELLPEELETLTQLRQLPDRQIQKLAGDAGRNRTLLESIAGLDDDWPILLFALSVEHAQTMAALLSREGISAAAIYSESDPGLRRHYIDRFRRGQLRVLTNYGVLTAGFDAPKVRALYVARPVYTPNTYQQMIGRGLRGPMNGGTDRCLLVNVADNVAQFGGRLAFHEFEYLWREEDSMRSRAVAVE
jgi:superfamily II DNA or RNA helicase